MNGPQVTRRGFMQGLAAIAGLSAVERFRFLEIPGKEAVVEAPAIAPVTLDTPITVDTPLCWIEIDGQRHRLLDASVEMRRNYLRAPDAFGQWEEFVPALQSWEMRCQSADLFDASMMYSGPHEFVLRLPNSLLEFGGSGYATEFSTGFNGAMVVADFTIQGMGPLRMM